MDNLMKVYNILKDIRPEYDFEKYDNFIDEGLLDSFDMVSFVSALEEEYNIIIDGMDIIPENFNNIQSIFNVLKKNGAEL